MLHRGFLFRGGAAWHVGKILKFSYFGDWVEKDRPSAITRLFMNIHLAVSIGAKPWSPITKVRPKEPNYGPMRRRALTYGCRLVGLLGFEPRTKRFTLPKRFRPAWTISSPLVVRLPVGCGTLWPVIKGAASPQVVSAPSRAAARAWPRIAMRDFFFAEHARRFP